MRFLSLFVEVLDLLFQKMAISKNWQKLIRSLHQKKYRKEEGLFLVEGEKVVLELLQSDYEIVRLFGTKEFFQKNKIHSFVNQEIVSSSDLVSVGTFQTNEACLAVVKQKKMTLSDFSNENLTIVLDNLQDPGNLGTILRICDWYKISKVVCSNETVDFYNPKVINASKASFLRVGCVYTNLSDFLEKSQKQNIEIYGTMLDGENIYDSELKFNSIVVIGNEANGISRNILKFISKSISIPRFGKAESLNAGVATAVVIDNFFRKNYYPV